MDAIREGVIIKIGLIRINLNCCVVVESAYKPISEDIAASFSRVLNSIVPFPEAEIEKALAISQVKTIPKKSFFICEGQKPHSFAFVYRGLFRYAYIDQKGRDFTKGFFPELSFISSYSALIQNRESYFSIEALEDSIILEIPYETWKRLIKEKLCWHKFLIALLEKGFTTKEKREREFLLLSAEARYSNFKKTYPGLDKRIKQHLIASYLGITPVAFSRMKKKVALT